MSEMTEVQAVESTIETELVNIDEARLPRILADRLELLEQTNRAYNDAKNHEEIARKKVGKVLKSADDLIVRAKGAGKHTAKTKSFLFFDWTSKSDEIDALKTNLKEMIDCGIHSAEAQKELVEVQAALADSQTALLKVQETQLAYQGQIADATKFLYGLSAYNMASIQSVLINLQAVLSGESKEKLGEMAQQQLLLAMDQLKNQESIILKIKRNKELILNLEKREDEHDRVLAEQIAKDEEHDKVLAKHAEKDKEHDRLLAVSAVKDEEHDKVLAEHAKKDKEHDRLLAVSAVKDEEHDKILAEHAKKDKEHDRLLAASAVKDEEHDKVLAEHAKKDEEHDRLLAASAVKDEEHDKVLAEHAKKDKEHDRLLAASAAKDEEHDKVLAEHAKKDKEHDRLLAASAAKDEEHDKVLAEHAKKDEEHDRLLAASVTKDEEHDEMFLKLQEENVELLKKIEANSQIIEELREVKTDKKVTYISYIISSVALLVAVAQFFI